METEKPSEASLVVADTVNVNEVGPSRRELLIQGGKVATGIGVAALLGNLGAFTRESYGMGQPTMSLLNSLMPAKTALLVIDMQRDFLLPSRPSAQSESCLPWHAQPVC